jgi:hypothetical protein
VKICFAHSAQFMHFSITPGEEVLPTATKEDLHVKQYPLPPI